MFSNPNLAKWLDARDRPLDGPLAAPRAVEKIVQSGIYAEDDYRYNFHDHHIKGDG
jgi:hypothetical protein